MFPGGCLSSNGAGCRTSGVQEDGRSGNICFCARDHTRDARPKPATSAHALTHLRPFASFMRSIAFTVMAIGLALLPSIINTIITLRTQDLDADD